MLEKYYHDTPVLDYLDILDMMPRNDTDLIENFLTCKLWRLNNLYKITNKVGKLVTFKMNEAQHKIYGEGIRHQRAIILKSRQQGISTFYLVSFCDDAIFNPHLKVGLMAQGKAEASTLLARTKLLWNEFPEGIKQYLGIKKVTDSQSELGFNNNSQIFIRTSFRSTTLQRLHVSEFGKIAHETPARAKETLTGTLQAIAPGGGNVVAFESTAEGENLFKTLWDNSVDRDEAGELAPSDFKPIFLSWKDDPTCVSSYNEDKTGHEAYLSDATPEQANFWIAKYRELGEKVRQEYPATPEEAFAKSLDHAFYAEQYISLVMNKGRRKSNLYDESLEVQVSVDLGINDETVFLFWQIYKHEIRLIDEYRGTGLSIKNYVDYLNSLEYTISKVIFPHDVKVREMGTGVSRYEKFLEFGVRNGVIMKKMEVIDGIDEVRSKIIPYLWIDTKCYYAHKCFQNYSKTIDARTGFPMNRVPLHDEWSHGADAIRYFAMSRPSRAEFRLNNDNTSGAMDV